MDETFPPAPAPVVPLKVQLPEVGDRERAFLARASELLASSLDYDATLALVTRLAVEGLADWCAVDELGPDGALRRIAVAHPDPAKVELAHRLHQRYPPDPHATRGVAQVLRTGVPEVVGEIPDEWLVQGTRDAEHLAMVRALGLHAYLCVPLVARGRVLGALTLVSAESRRVFGPVELWVAEQLAGRAAVAIDNARLFRESEEARMLAQEAAAELEAQTAELMAQAAELEEMQAELELTNDELLLANQALAAHAQRLDDAHRASEEARAFLDAFLDAAPVAVAFLDRDLRYRRINQALAEFDGTSQEAALGRTLHEVVPQLAPRLEPLYRHVLETGEAIRGLEISGPRLRDPGQTAHFLVNYFPVRVDGGAPLGVGLVALDLSDRKRAEEQERLFAQVMEESRSEIYLFDAETLRFLRVNRGARENLGYSEEELRSLTPLDLKPELPAERFNALAAPLRAGTEEVVRFETVHRRRDGTVYPVDVHLQLSHAGERPVFVAMVLDVSDRRETERELRAAKETAEEANRAKGQFLANMSHELRTPLNAIGGYVDLLELGVHGPLTEVQLHSLTRVKKNQTHLLGLINDILNFARLEAGRVELRRDAVEVHAALSEMEALISPQVQARGLRYTFDGCDAGLRVWGDAERIQQVLLNLLGNAVKFTAAGGWVRLRCEAGAEQVRIHVDDNGRGIAPERLEPVFDPFVQVDRHTVAESQQGVGLGLAISRELARGMGGDLVARSTVGVGSTFTLLLPRADDC